MLRRRLPDALTGRQWWPLVPQRAPSPRSDREISTVGQVRVGLASLSLRPEGDVPASGQRRGTMPVFPTRGRCLREVGERERA